MNPTEIEYIQVARDPLGLPKLALGSCFVLKGNGPRPPIPLVRMRTDEGKTVMIQTKPMQLPRGLIHTEEGHYLLVLNSEENKELFSIITRLESEANERLAEAAVAGIAGLDDKLLRKLSPKGDNLRPTFNEQGKAFLKLSQDCVVFDWIGRGQIEGELKRGRYQFLLRCANVYVGQHGQSNYPASLQFKVAQIRYEALPEPNLAEQKFLFLENDEEDYTVNHLPSGQAHAAQMGLIPETPVKRKRQSKSLPKLKLPLTMEVVDLDASPVSIYKNNDLNQNAQYFGSQSSDSQWVPNVSGTQATRDPELWNSH